MQAVNLRSSEAGMSFEILDNRDESSTQNQEFELNLFGTYNVRNALGVIILARYNGIADKTIQSAFDSFQSVRRRQELRGEVNGIAVYDDFAHHPTAVRETVTAIKQKHPGRRLIAVFEPRSNTSVLKIHQDALIDSFKKADEVILTTPHRLELTPLEQQLEVREVLKSLTKIKIPAYEFPQVEGIIKHLKLNCRSGDVVLIMSNGKFDNIHQRLLEEL